MADETTTAVPEAEQIPAPVEHTADVADPNAIENALEALAEQSAPEVAPVPATDKPGEDLEPLGLVTNCP
ncbi:hypothetical protein ACFY00_29755 [Kitasatospora sp. NPDC001540]|uniref:hypothetical protein n=1 Tax=Kitasatospora sp. NPDC001540 TaxID=3364014 RepID=UPI00369E0B90